VSDDFDFVGDNASVSTTFVTIVTARGGWSSNTSSGTGSVVQADGEQNHPGVCQLTCPSSQRILIQRGGPTIGEGCVRADQIETSTFIFKLGGTANTRFRIGWMNTVTLASHSGFMIEYDSTVDGNVRALTQIGGSGSSTVIDTADTDWHKIVIAQTAVGTITYTLDGVLVATHTGALVVPSSTTLNPVFFVGTSTAVTNTLLVDLFAFTSKTLTR
jgi:hypothetical protein